MYYIHFPETKRLPAEVMEADTLEEVSKLQMERCAESEEGVSTYGTGFPVEGGADGDYELAYNGRVFAVEGRWNILVQH